MMGQQAIIQQFIEDDRTDRLLRNVARMEQQDREAVRALQRAAGFDTVVDPARDPDERVTELKAVLRTLASGDLRDYWLEHQAPAALDIDGIREYLGMSREAWEAQVERWAAHYREGTDDPQVREADDRDLAAAHVRTHFGVALSVFEGLVVGWEPSDALEAAFEGPTTTTRAGIEAVTERLEGGNS